MVRLVRPLAPLLEGAAALPGRAARPGAPSLPRPTELLRTVLRRPRARLALLAAVLALPVLAGGWLLVRHSPLVSVTHVRIRGVHGQESAAIEAALERAAHGMSTLDYSAGKLRAAVAAFPVVADVRASASFPHSLSITVDEQLPVAALQTGSFRTAVAGDGVVLGPALLSSSLPTLAAPLELSTGAHLHNVTLLASVALLAAAPAPIRAQVSSLYEGPKGLTASMRNGLLVYLGDATLAHAKWDSLVAVLGDSGSAGASYVDVRLPSHPAAGFGSGASTQSSGAGAHEGSSSSSSSSSSGSESTVGVLATALGKATPQAAAPGAPPTGSAAAESAERSAQGGAASGEEAGSTEHPEGG